MVTLFKLLVDYDLFLCNFVHVIKLCYYGPICLMLTATTTREVHTTGNTRQATFKTRTPIISVEIWLELAIQSSRISLLGRYVDRKGMKAVLSQGQLLFLQGVSIALLCKPCISYDRHVCPSVRPSVRLSACHTLTLCENDAS